MKAGLFAKKQYRKLSTSFLRRMYNLMIRPFTELADDTIHNRLLQLPSPGEYRNNPG